MTDSNLLINYSNRKQFGQMFRLLLFSSRVTVYNNTDPAVTNSFILFSHSSLTFTQLNSFVLILPEHFGESTLEGMTSRLRVPVAYEHWRVVKPTGVAHEPNHFALKADV